MKRFTASSSRVTGDFYKLMKSIEATSLKINQDVMENKVEVVFDRKGFRYVFRCEKWGDVGDNLRAIYHTIRFLHKAIAEFGVVKEQVKFDDVFNQVFGGFIATPDDSVLMIGDGKEPWFSILGVEENADKKSIMNAYRSLAKIHHPDAGGNTETFKKLREAYDKGIAQLK